MDALKSKVLYKLLDALVRVVTFNLSSFAWYNHSILLACSLLWIYIFFIFYIVYKEYYYNRLTNAIQYGNLDVVKQYRHHLHGISNLALKSAVQFGHYDIAEYIIDSTNPNLNFCDNKFGDDTILHVCVRYGRLDIAYLLIQKGAYVNFINNFCETALYTAILRGNYAMAQLLIDNGANVNYTNRERCSPLYLAASFNYVHIASLLVEHGADKHFPNNRGETALHVAARNNCMAMVRYLLSIESDPIDANAQCAYQKTTPLVGAVSVGNHAMVDLLLHRGADINHVFSYSCTSGYNDVLTPGYTLLMLAASRGSVEMVEHLLQEGADPNLVNQAGETAITMAVKSCPQAVRLFSSYENINVDSSMLNKANTKTRLLMAYRPLPSGALVPTEAIDSSRLSRAVKRLNVNPQCPKTPLDYVVRYFVLERLLNDTAEPWSIIGNINDDIETLREVMRPLVFIDKHGNRQGVIPYYVRLQIISFLIHPDFFKLGLHKDLEAYQKPDGADSWFPSSLSLW